jgi:hypothetical protein
MGRLARQSFGSADAYRAEERQPVKEHGELPRASAPMSNKEIVHVEIVEPGHEPHADPVSALALGSWWWVREPEKDDWLGCVMQIGSNFVELKSPIGIDQRIHLDQIDIRLRVAPDAAEYIAQRVGEYQVRSRGIIQQIQDVSNRLGLNPLALADASSTALAVVSEQPDIKSYEKALTTARDKTLPELFKALRANSEAMAEWMVADTLPLEASINPLEGSIAVVKDRIFNVSLYAGLSEETVQVAKGKPAALAEPLHVMQRRLYMDEECLLDYQAGGMEFKDIRKFDAWLAKPKHRDRMLPFPRTLVAMRVRRTDKDHESSSALDAFIKMRIAEADKLTFLYIRNGDQVWRLSCELEFDELVFPDPAVFNPNEPKMVKMFCSRVDKIITRREYDVLVANYHEEQKRAKEWDKTHPKKDHFFNPHRHGVFSSDDPRRDYDPFDTTNLYYDEVAEHVENEFKKYNRIALLIQGLFDRSGALHPHGPVQTWKPDGFAKAVRLVNDATGALHHGDKPDFEAYRARLNESLSTGSMTVGQERQWLIKEAITENARMDRVGRGRDFHHYTTFRPYGNPGPGLIAKVANWQRKSQRAVFRWKKVAEHISRERLYMGESHRVMNRTLTVPASKLLNVSAYTKGDYQQFFADPRTRADYLQWAPLLLAAEDWVSGKRPLIFDDDE